MSELDAMRIRVSTRLLVLVLALLVPVLEFVAVGCDSTVASHHESELVDAGSHSSSPHERDSRHAPVQSPADCPMKVPCRGPALHATLLDLFFTRLSVESLADEPAAIPSNNDRSSLKPPPKHPA